jgi:hypothetical protein
MLYVLDIWTSWNFASGRKVVAMILNGSIPNHLNPFYDLEPLYT